MYKLQSNIPIPPRSNPKERKRKYPFKDMQVGMSFLVPKKEAANDIDKLMKRIGPAAHSAGTSLGFKFALRRMSDGVRVWRVQ